MGARHHVGRWQGGAPGVRRPLVGKGRQLIVKRRRWPPKKKKNRLVRFLAQSGEAQLGVCLGAGLLSTRYQEKRPIRPGGTNAGPTASPRIQLENQATAPGAGPPNTSFGAHAVRGQKGKNRQTELAGKEMGKKTQSRAHTENKTNGPHPRAAFAPACGNQSGFFSGVIGFTRGRIPLRPGREAENEKNAQ